MNKLRILLPIGVLAYIGVAAAADDKGPRGHRFDTLDINGDGLVSLIEFQDRENNGLMAMDSDNNGVLTLDEFLNARPSANMGMRPGRGNRPDSGQREPSAEQMAKMQELRTLRATERFQVMDTDGDEIVTLSEFQAATFAELDRNDDGALDADEMRGPRMGRPGPDGRGPGRPRGGRTPNN